MSTFIAEQDIRSIQYSEVVKTPYYFKGVPVYDPRTDYKIKVAFTPNIWRRVKITPNGAYYVTIDKKKRYIEESTIQKLFNRKGNKMNSEVIYVTETPEFTLQERTNDTWESIEGFKDSKEAIQMANQLQLEYPTNQYRVIRWN